MLIAELHVLPEGWSYSTMSDYQLMFVQHWLEFKRLRERRSLGELLGVYWTSDRYKNSKGSEDKKHKEAFIPLAAVLAPDTLYKTLDKTLETALSDGMTMTDFGEAISLGSLPFKDFQEMFNQNKPEVLATQVVSDPNQAVSSKEPKLDLEKLRKIDPELARHFDPDYKLIRE